MTFRTLMHGLLLLWALAMSAVWRDGYRLATRAALLFVPLLLLGVHVFYQVWVYYPRHIIAGYLAMGVATVLAHGPHASGPGDPRRRALAL